MDWFPYVLLYLLGLGLCFAELFIPSGGVLGIAAALCLGFSLYELYLASWPLALACVFLTLAYLVVLVRWGLSRFRLDTNLKGGVATGADVQTAAGMIGSRGRAVTPLRPAGVAEIEGRRFDVVTRGGFIAAGDPVEVVEADGNRILVRPR